MRVPPLSRIVRSIKEHDGLLFVDVVPDSRSFFYEVRNPSEQIQTECLKFYTIKY